MYIPHTYEPAASNTTVEKNASERILAVQLEYMLGQIFQNGGGGKYSGGLPEAFAILVGCLPLANPEAREVAFDVMGKMARSPRLRNGPHAPYNQPPRYPELGVHLAKLRKMYPAQVKLG